METENNDAFESKFKESTGGLFDRMVDFFHDKPFTGLTLAVGLIGGVYLLTKKYVDKQAIRNGRKRYEELKLSRGHKFNRFTKPKFKLVAINTDGSDTE